MSCFIGAVAARTSSEKEASPTFYKAVLPILQQHCQSCHRPGEIAPTSFVTYAETKPWASAIAEATRAHKMPPWFADPKYGKFSNDPSLTSSEVEALSSWAANGAPAGDPNDAPPGPRWTQGWNITRPDLVVSMPKPVSIPAQGDVEYTYEIVPTGFKENKWVQMSEFRPSSRDHVHHAVVYIRPPDSVWLRGAPVGMPFTASSLDDPKLRHQAHATDSDLLLVYIATCSWCMRPEARRNNGPMEWRSSFPLDQTSCSKCTTRPTVRRQRIRPASGWYSRKHQ
jgi:hypothetical protein